MGYVFQAELSYVGQVCDADLRQLFYRLDQAWMWKHTLVAGRSLEDFQDFFEGSGNILWVWASACTFASRSTGMYLFVGWTRMYVLSWTNGGRRFWAFSWKPPEFQVEGQGKNSQLVDLSHWAPNFRLGTKLSWDIEMFRMCLGCF